MNTRKHTKLVHAGKYAAEVVIEIIGLKEGWSHISASTMR
jgi:hypothetical protein